jgi:hypothetical protein
MADSSQYYGNRILKEFKEKSVSPFDAADLFADET